MEEYYLLYYEWKCVELPEDPGYNSRPTDIVEDLIYCVSIGNLDTPTAQAIAEKYEINYHVENGVWKHFHGFVHYDWVGKEPDEGFFAPFYEMRPRQSLTESLAAACDVAMRRFEEDKDSPLGDGFRNTCQNVRQEVEDAGKSDVVSQPVISTDDPLVVSTPFPLADREQPSDDLRDYIDKRLAGGPRCPFENFDILLEPDRSISSVDIFLYRLFWVQNTFTLIYYNEEYFQRLSGDKVLENRGFLYSPFWGFSKIPVFLCKRSCPAVGTPLFSSV